jgi:hypothetical protein
MVHLELERFFLPARPGRFRNGCAGLDSDPFGWNAGGPPRPNKGHLFFQAIQMCCPVLLVLLILTGTIHVWMIIALSLIVGITDALSMPAFQSIVPSIVNPNQIGTAIALNSTQHASRDFWARCVRSSSPGAYFVPVAMIGVCRQTKNALRPGHIEM